MTLSTNNSVMPSFWIVVPRKSQLFGEVWCITDGYVTVGFLSFEEAVAEQHRRNNWSEPV